MIVVFGNDFTFLVNHLISLRKGLAQRILGRLDFFNLLLAPRLLLFLDRLQAIVISILLGLVVENLFSQVVDRDWSFFAQALLNELFDEKERVDALLAGFSIVGISFLFLALGLNGLINRCTKAFPDALLSLDRHVSRNCSQKFDQLCLSTSMIHPDLDCLLILLAHTHSYLTPQLPRFNQRPKSKFCHADLFQLQQGVRIGVLVLSLPIPDFPGPCCFASRFGVGGVPEALSGGDFWTKKVRRGGLGRSLD